MCLKIRSELEREAWSSPSRVIYLLGWAACLRTKAGKPTWHNRSDFIIDVLLICRYSGVFGIESCDEWWRHTHNWFGEGGCFVEVVSRLPANQGALWTSVWFDHGSSGGNWHLGMTGGLYTWRQSSGGILSTGWWQFDLLFDLQKPDRSIFPGTFRAACINLDSKPFMVSRYS